MSEKTKFKASCPSCHHEVQLLQSKTGRLLFLCRHCGLQAFDRGQGCKAWFGQLVKNWEARQ